MTFHRCPPEGPPMFRFSQKRRLSNRSRLHWPPRAGLHLLSCAWIVARTVMNILCIQIQKSAPSWINTASCVCSAKLHIRVLRDCIGRYGRGIKPDTSN
jgi:hypothetical protein